MTTELGKLNPHIRDLAISFDEASHVYTVNGDSTFTSVTTFIHKFFPEFNAESVIEKMRNGRDWGPHNKYYGKTNKEITTEWSNSGKEASALGTSMHLNIENYYNSRPFDDKFIATDEYKLFQKYLQDYANYKAYRTEWQIYATKYKIAGSIDMVYHDPNNPGKFIIADWKRSKEIKFENPYEKGLPPIQHVPHCNYWHYTLQLNLYRLILEKYYSLEISEMFLVILHPNNDTYVRIDISRISKELIEMLNIKFKSQ